MSDELAKRSDGFDEPEINGRVIQGTLIKCVDGQWKTGDGVAIPPGTRLLALATIRVVQRWQDQKPVDTIFKESGQDSSKLLDELVDELNAKIPEAEWEIGVDGKSKQPWQWSDVVYLLDPESAERFTFANGTGGAKRAVSNLRDRVVMKRSLGGENVIPVVELGSALFSRRYNKLRPDFRVAEWAEFAPPLTRDVTPQIEQQSKPAEDTAAPKKKKAKLRKVQPPSAGAEMDDEIPF